MSKSKRKRRRARGRLYAAIQRHKNLLGEFKDGQVVDLQELNRLCRRADKARDTLKAEKLEKAKAKAAA